MLTPARVSLAQGAESSRVQVPLRPVGCCLLPDKHFDFDSSFLRPDVAESLGRLAAKRKANPGSPISLFGHADPVGQDEYNKSLSDRRVKAVYGLLVRDAAVWEELFSQPAGNDNWGQKGLQSMLKAVGNDPGPIDGKAGPKTHQATLDFQAAKGLPGSGFVDLATRKALFEAYMDVLHGKDSRPLDREKDFLAGRADSKGKGDFQGCGEFNPILVFSKAESQALEKDKSERNAENTANRRVTALLFEPESKVNPALWPCPRAGEGSSGCRARFFSDGDMRRSFRDQRRRNEDTRDTFACRFYDTLAGDLPCESVAGGRPAALRVTLRDARGKRVKEGTPFRVHIGGKTRDGAVGADGLVVMDDVILRDVDLIEWGRDFPALSNADPEIPEGLRRKITDGVPRHPFLAGFKPDPVKDVFLFRGRPILDSDHEAVDDPIQMDKRLLNLGYAGEETVDARLDSFRIAHRLEQADGRDKVGLRDVHRDGLEMPDPEEGDLTDPKPDDAESPPLDAFPL
ncbi:MAG TPA: peptidoglycan-binding protein [Fibrobacteria bacterium]|nr:peptidoglycan-binding protein [Fibrobacteria bacterium]